MTRSLLERFNVPGPPFTSYPALAHWDDTGFDQRTWLDRLLRCYTESNDDEGTGLYVHLPFCNATCTLCGSVRILDTGSDMEHTYLGEVEREWSLYVDHFSTRPRIRSLHLGGGASSLFPRRALSGLVDAIVGSAIIGDPFEFSFVEDPSSTTREHLRLMRALGFQHVRFLLEDLDPVVQRTIDRPQPFGVVAAVTDAARDLDYVSVGYDLLYGLPRQRLTGIVETMGKVVSLKPDRIGFRGYVDDHCVARTGTRCFAEAEIPRGEQKRALYEVGRDLLLEAGYCEIGVDHFALETDSLFPLVMDRTLQCNLVGYTPFSTQLCLGLGAAAISDARYAYAQNVPSLTTYHQRVDAGKLPIFRGHCLSDRDLLLRRLVHDLACRYEAGLPLDAAAAEILAECGPRLQELQCAGLVCIEGGSIRITEKGRPFVRSACLALDPRLQQDFRR